MKTLEHWIDRTTTSGAPTRSAPVDVDASSFREPFGVQAGIRPSTFPRIHVTRKPCRSCR